MAAQEYLRGMLKFNEQEIQEMNITDTQMSSKGDDTMYIAFDDPIHVRDIHIRLAECRDNRLWSRDFVPPQCYKRYMAIAKLAKEMRSEDSSTKTQMRFGSTDIELYTKKRGTESPFKKVPIETIEEKAKLPRFDHSKTWTRKTDRPPRRTVSPNGRTSELPSLRKERRISDSSNDAPTKKRKEDDKSSSSSSSDDNESQSSRKKTDAAARMEEDKSL